ncbi:MAG: hypothetical protein IJP46_06050 [Prevotella sp.]|nr:hypothetical protein [Prevotella sp.]
MKKIFTLLAGVLFAMTASAQMISFTADDVASQGTLDGKVFSNGDFKITLADDQGKMAIDANNGYFGTADDFQKFTHRLKSGAKSQGAGKLCQISVTIPSNGELKIYARTGSNSATDRNVVVTQNGESLYNEIVKEDEAVSIELAENIDPEKNPTGATNIYPIRSVNVTAGSALITFPTGSINFYAFEFVSDGSSVTPATPHEAQVWDFTTTTSEMLGAGWSADASTDGRYVYDTEIAAETYVDLGEIGFSYGAGISVGRIGGKLAAKAIRVDTGKAIQMNASNGVYKITDLAKNDKVSIRYKSASDEDRTFTVDNGDVATLNAPMSSADNALQETTITVAADGALVLTQSKAINIIALAINADLPEATGISTIKAENAANAAMYDLSGRRVDANYRGVVIVNGVKKIQK